MNDETADKAGSFDIGFMRPEDTPSLVELLRAVYGDHFPIREMYDPEHLRRQQERGEMYHVVARDASCRVIGHAALFHSSAPFYGLWESGLGMVLPEFRNLGLANAIMEASFRDLMPGLGVEEVWGETVASHIYMQKTSVLLGAYQTGIELDLMPESSFEKELGSKGRVSTVLTFKTLKSRAQTIFLPPAYEEIIRFTYAHAFDFGHTFLPADRTLAAGKESSIESSLFEDAGVGRITFLEIGSDATERVRPIEEGLRNGKAVIFQAFIKLTDPLAGTAVDLLRQSGYFLAGVLPRWFDDDGLMMQKLTHEPNFDGIKLYTDTSMKLLDYIRKDRDAVAKPSDTR